MTGLQNHRRNSDKRESDFETVVDDIDGDIDVSYIDDNDITGETTTREKRKMRSATQILM